MTYKYYPDRPKTLTKEFVQSEFARLTSEVESAESGTTREGWLRLFAEWNALKSYVQSEGNRIHYAQSKDMTNTAIDEAERYYREAVNPVAEASNFSLSESLLKSKHRDAISQRYGDHLLQQIETTVKPLSPVNSDLRVKDGEIGNRYDKLVSSGEVTIAGETQTLARASNQMTNDNEAIRHEAFSATRGWFVDHHDEIADIYDQMVHLRHQMGKNLGYENFIPLGYLSMERTDYGPSQAKTFRDSVRQYVVPLQQRLNELHAKELGGESLKPWNTAYVPSITLPNGIAPIDTQLDNADRLFDKLSGRLAGHFRKMRTEGLIDLENRKGKRSGAFCTTFSDEGRVAILCNSTGNQGDVGTLIHEMGHAFQGWESASIEAVDLQTPTSDAAEIDSMGMEFLSLRHIDEFFAPEHADRFKKNKWRSSVMILCYICVVDEFQHWVYTNPAASPADRDAAWNRIWNIYLPGVDYEGLQKEKAARWYMQGHIFRSPFYYIDYAIAETGAMQFALMDAEDSGKALDTYMKICRIGGTQSVLSIFKSAGLRSPFDGTVMRDLMAHAAVELGAN